EALLNRRPELEYSLACGITQRLLDTEMMLLRTIAEKDRRLAQALTRAKFAEQDQEYGPDNLEPHQAMDAEDIRTDRGIGTLPIRVQTFGNFVVLRGETRVPDQSWRARSPKLMLKALIARGASGVPKDLLIDDLWPQA